MELVIYTCRTIFLILLTILEENVNMVEQYPNVIELEHKSEAIISRFQELLI